MDSRRTSIALSSCEQQPSGFALFLYFSRFYFPLWVNVHRVFGTVYVPSSPPRETRTRLSSFCRSLFAICSLAFCSRVVVKMQRTAAIWKTYFSRFGLLTEGWCCGLTHRCFLVWAERVIYLFALSEWFVVGKIPEMSEKAAQVRLVVYQ